MRKWKKEECFNNKKGECMKKCLLLLGLSTIFASQINFAGEKTVTVNLRTEVFNNSDKSVYSTWTASSSWARWFRDIASHIKDTSWVSIAPGKSYAFLHTGDTLLVKYTDANGKEQTVAYDAQKDKYGKEGMEIVNSGDDLKILPKGGTSCPVCPKCEMDCSKCKVKGNQCVKP